MIRIVAFLGQRWGPYLLKLPHFPKTYPDALQWPRGEHANWLDLPQLAGGPRLQPRKNMVEVLMPAVRENVGSWILPRTLLRD